jgi:hypothetical protein
MGINTDGSDPYGSSMLDVKSTTKGLLLPRVALTGTGDVTTIASAATSLFVYNTANGMYALNSNTTGNNNTALGYSAFSTSSAYSNSAGIGYNAQPGASDTVRIGNSSVTSIGGYEPCTDLSDSRFKLKSRKLKSFLL